jgi:GntR family transcriptional regulator
VRVPPNIAQALKLPPGSPGYRIIGVRHSENGPFQHVTAWLPEPIGKRIAEEDVSNSSILATIERHLGTEVKFLEQVVDAALAPRNVAELLQLRPRTPLLRFERTYIAANGEPVEHAVSYQTGRRYPYRVILSQSDRRG